MEVENKKGYWNELYKEIMSINIGLNHEFEGHFDAVRKGSLCGLKYGIESLPFIIPLMCISLVGKASYSGFQAISETNSFIQSHKNLIETQQTISERTKEDLIAKYKENPNILSVFDIHNIGNDLSLEGVVYGPKTHIEVIPKSLDITVPRIRDNILQITLDDARRLTYDADYKSEL